MQPPPTLKNTEKNRCGTKKTAERKREPPKKKKVCWREEEETATGQKRPPEKKREPPKNEKAGRWEGRAVMGREKSAKKREETRFPTVKKNKNGPFGDLSERESFIIFMSFYRNRSDMAQTFDIFLIVMALLALVVFAALHFLKPDTAISSTPNTGRPCPTRSAGC